LLCAFSCECENRPWMTLPRGDAAEIFLSLRQSPSHGDLLAPAQALPANDRRPPLIYGAATVCRWAGKQWLALRRPCCSE